MCLDTQTPLVQFLGGPSSSSGDDGSFADLGQLTEGIDYRFSPGGVTRMVYPLVSRMLQDGFLDEGHWVSLNSYGPSTVRAGGITLHHIALDRAQMAGYGEMKEAIWSTAHGTPSDLAGSEDAFWTDAFSEYTYYNRRCAELIARLDAKVDFDLIYAHDFQQLPLGQMLGRLKPKIFRWHIPFGDTPVPEAWRPVLSDYFNSYDMVIVSNARYLRAMERFGYTGQAKRLYPYVDPGEFGHPEEAEVRARTEPLGLAAEDEVALVVARMDPMKGQDRAIRALAALAPRHPHLKLALVGNGSFSGSARGVGLSKSALWRAELERLAEELGVRDRVLLLGHRSQADLDALYERAAFTVLPSLREGFGLVAIESWLHGRAAIVSDRAGVAELVRSGTNGLRFDPDDPSALARAMERLLADPALAARLGRSGRTTARRCTIETGLPAERAIISDLVGG